MEGKDVSKVLTFEGSVPMIAGIIVGIVIGILSNLSMVDVIMRLSGGQFTLIDYRTVLIIIVSLMISLIASYYASLKSTKVPTIDLLSDRERPS